MAAMYTVLPGPQKQNYSPKPIFIYIYIAQKAIILHTFGVQVGCSGLRTCHQQEQLSGPSPLPQRAHVAI